MSQIITIPSTHELVKVSDTEYKIVKKEEKLPKSWSEFCENYPYISGESYIQSNCCISELTSGPRSFAGSRNVLPNKEYAEAILALCQLIQLRNCYRKEWKPDFRTSDTKWCICFEWNNLRISPKGPSNSIFAFQSEKVAKEFLENFKDLIEKTKPLFM